MTPEQSDSDPMTTEPETSPPAAITLWFCPACGQQVKGTYDVHEFRPKCTKSIHKVSPRPFRYVREGAIR